MKKFIKNLMGLTASLVIAGAFSPVLADTATPAATAAATPAPPAVTVDGLVDTYYSYDFNSGNVGGVNGYFYNNVDNSFTLALAEAKFTATQGPASAHLVLAYGQETALGLTAGSTGAATGLGFDVLQGYLAYTAGQFTFAGGKFVTWMGNEFIESTSNWNYSHSLLFGVIPFWHTGLSVMFMPSSTFMVTGYAVDGNNTVNSSSDGKTYGLQAVITPNSQWNFTVNGLIGPTAGNATVPNDNTNLIGEAIIKFLPDSMWSFGLDAQYGTTSAPVGSSPSYWGLALYGRDQISSDWAAALRVEDLTDSGELGFGSTTVAGSLYEGTLTVEHDFTANLLGRLEGRFDTNALPTGVGTATAAAPIYPNGTSTSQVTATYSMVMTY
jgi:hypothetical protein